MFLSAEKLIRKACRIFRIFEPLFQVKKIPGLNQALKGVFKKTRKKPG